MMSFQNVNIAHSEEEKAIELNEHSVVLYQTIKYGHVRHFAIDAVE
jgi:hypothetical protein